MFGKRNQYKTNCKSIRFQAIPCLHLVHGKADRESTKMMIKKEK